MPELLSTLEAADYCGLSPRTLEKRRMTGGGPQFVKLGHAVRYSTTDLEAWIAENRCRSTSDPGPEPERKASSTVPALDSCQGVSDATLEPE
ncbi:MAG TPA: helix-turn-helix domain-containing protein [Thermoanaerobaculia bacterium]|nr:helix-turn-helix domain-containing protein [Thermoanaerobaculia bacterium]